MVDRVGYQSTHVTTQHELAYSQSIPDRYIPKHKPLNTDKYQVQFDCPSRVRGFLIVQDGDASAAQVLLQMRAKRAILFSGPVAD